LYETCLRHPYGRKDHLPVAIFTDETKAAITGPQDAADSIATLARGYQARVQRRLTALGR
jgi:hypothetical protein